MVLQVAQHRFIPNYPNFMADREVMAINEWLCNGTRAIDRCEHPLQWRKLKRILASYNCTFTFPKVGNRINICRQIKKKGLVRKIIEDINTQVAYSDDGRDADVSVIKKIRNDLQLDDEHGIDSYSFYSSRPSETSDFIVKYRKILDRLAKL